MSTETLLGLLRGKKVVFHTVKGHTRLVCPSLYPFKDDEIPLQCIPPRNGLPSFKGYTSGSRSIVQQINGRWFKAKAIGIPTGESRPFYVGGKIYSYYLFDTIIGSGQVIWGLSSIAEAETECSRTIEAKEHDLPVPEVIGLGYYEQVYVLDMKNRRELFQLIKKMQRDTLLKHLKSSSRRIEAACVFMAQPSDVRVDEILYGILHPKIQHTINSNDIKAFLRWLGSSCGLNLRAHHDLGILHGTVPTKGALITNSHTANHLVDEKGTYITDYHIPSVNVERFKKAEIFFLASVMNPLVKADAAARKMFQPIDSSAVPRSSQPSQGYMELFLGSGVGLMNYLEKTDDVFRPRNVQEEFTKTFLEGLKQGYEKRKVHHVEEKIRRELLVQAASAKKELFQLLGLPEGMQRGGTYIKELMKEHGLSPERSEA